MNTVPTLTPVPPAFEQPVPSASSSRTYLVHGVDTLRMSAADTSRPAPRWGA